jgi:hypothetical protein
MDPWDAEVFLRQLKDGEFDNRMHKALVELSQEQLQALIQLLEQRTKEK